MQEYIIQPNDTLFVIAKDNKIPLAQLIRANPEITDPNLLYIGQVIQIPDPIPIPNQIGIIEEAIGSLFSDIQQESWNNAKDKMTTIETNISELTPLMQAALVPRDLISSINLASRNLAENIKLQNTYPTMAYANNITGYIPGILEYFKIGIPTDLKRLEYLGREFIINADNNDWNEANNNYMRVKTFWERVKPQLEADYGKEVGEFDQNLKKLNDSIKIRDYKMTIFDATNLLRMIYQLEQNFLKK